MKLWILRPVVGDSAWTPWYDKAFGFVVVAPDEKSARLVAQVNCGDEDSLAWEDSMHSTCIELRADDYKTAQEIMRDFARA